jgi:hypothetical protein
MADHVQEHNKVYNQLLTEKLNSEDALKAQHKEDVTALNRDWQAKLADVVAKARAEEQDKARLMLQRTAEEFNKKEMELA